LAGRKIGEAVRQYRPDERQKQGEWNDFYHNGLCLGLLFSCGVAVIHETENWV
jgi:hypothetical protein